MSSLPSQAALASFVLPNELRHEAFTHSLPQSRSLYLQSASGFFSPLSAHQCGSLSSNFNGTSQLLAGALSVAKERPSSFRVVAVITKPAIQFIRGVDEMTVPDVKLTRSKDGTNGVATFLFDQPSVFDSSGESRDITGLYLIDEEGMLQSIDVSAKFVNGKLAKIEGRYVMRNQKEWDRFMRFMERYAEANRLGFVKS